MKATISKLVSLACLIFALTTPLLALAAQKVDPSLVEGAGSSNGGGVVKDGAITVFLDLVKKATEVPYDPTSTKAYKTLMQVMSAHKGSYDSTTVLQERVGVAKPIGTRIMEALDKLEFVMTVRSLPELDDAGFVILKWKINGQIKRLAIQSRHDNKVLVDKNLFLELVKTDTKTEKQVAAFLQHEALIRVYFDGVSDDKKLSTTEKISNIVNVTFGEDDSLKTLSPKLLARMLNMAGIPSTQQNLVGATVIPWGHFYSNDPTPVREKDYSRFYAFFYDSGALIEYAATGKFMRTEWHPSFGYTYFMPFSQVNDSKATGTLHMILGVPSSAQRTNFIISLDNQAEGLFSSDRYVNQGNNSYMETVYTLWSPAPLAK